MPKIFDRVAVESWQRDEIIQKFPREGLGDIKLGSQLIVNPGETAVFVRGGEAMGTFTPGRHTLTTENIPMLTDLFEAGYQSLGVLAVSGGSEGDGEVGAWAGGAEGCWFCRRYFWRLDRKSVV